MEVLLQGGPDLIEVTEPEADYILSCWMSVADSETGLEPAVTVTGKEISLPEGGPAIISAPPPPLAPGEVVEEVARPTAISALHDLCEEDSAGATPDLVWMRPAKPRVEQSPVAFGDDSEVRKLSMDEAPLKRSLRTPR